MHDVVERVAAASARSMLMIGVMPLPALMNSMLLRQRVGEHERALDAAEPHDRSGFALADEVRRDLALLDELRA